MNELNLCEILKGHEGETFYSRSYGDVVIEKCYNDVLEITPINYDNDMIVTYWSNGKICNSGEQDIFPSKDQQDWNKWVEENNHKIPKTWSELNKKLNSRIYLTHKGNKETDYYITQEGTTPIEKSALALLKIHQLIEVGYGGNVTNEEWNNVEWKYCVSYNTSTAFAIERFCRDKQCIAFHTKEQAEEFLSYPENVQLLRDYFMIN